ncbi:MAG: complement C1q domain-containing protein [Burkholderiaceae bacterium]|jgi:hypothetical protein|nr:complement C1q domain-containing protein [Burkholderiaceae bacterium]
MANVAPPGLTQIFDSNGNPAAGFLLYTYDAGTSTPRTTWSNSAETVANANPVVLDASGRAQIFWRGNYRVELRTPANAVVWSQDNFNVPDPSAATSIVFANGAVSTPSVRFAQATSSGLFSPAANVVAMSVNGVETMRWASGNVGIGGVPTQRLDVFGTARVQGTLTVTTGGVTVTAGGVTVTAGGLTVSAGGAAITGNSTVTGNLTVASGVFASRGFADNATAAAWNIDSAGRLRNNGSTQISFAARRITSNQSTAGAVVFQDVSFAGGHNVGSGYDVGTGVFTVPTGQQGVYHFCANVVIDNTSGGDANPGCYLRVNGSDIGANYAIRTGVGTAYPFNVYLNLAAGDTVRVQYNASIASAVLIGSTFSGRQVG